MGYPLRHVSIRVPWHDTGWDGRVCLAPRLNGACLKLKGISKVRDDDAEESIAGTSIKDLPQAKWPSCIVERAGFMAPFEYVREADHPYNRGPETAHGHFKRTPLRHPPYSAAAVPFAWMLRERMETLGEEHDLDVQADREPDLGFETPWVQEHLNQTALLDCFAGHLKPEQSLCFFYAKQVPFVEDSAGIRILIGVGRVLYIGTAQEYAYNTKNLNGKLRAMLWSERMIQHSIRPDFQNGFLLPYHAAVDKAAEDLNFDPAEIAAFSPADRITEFSYASQLVSHDGAIASLLACAESLRKAKGVLPGPWNQCLQWIDDRLGELWKARGPCPGLGSALSAFGLQFGTFVARVLVEKAGDNVDPWSLVDKMFADPQKHLPDTLAGSIGTTLCKKWSRLHDQRRALLKLVSRFEITGEQATRLYVQEERAKAGIDTSDAAILANPYLLYELTRLTADPISVWTVDRGVFPVEIIREKHPLPPPTALDAGTDARRVRALTIKVLEDAAGGGNTLLPQDQVVLAIRALSLQPPCQVDADLMNVARDDFEDAVGELTMTSGTLALQLGRLTEVGAIIRQAIDKRIKGKRLTVQADWRKLLNSHLATQRVHEHDDLEDAAREGEDCRADRTRKGAALCVDWSRRNRQDYPAVGPLFAPNSRGRRNLAARAYRKSARAYGTIRQGPQSQGLHHRPIPESGSLRRLDRPLPPFEQTDRGRRAYGHYRRSLDADGRDARSLNPGAQGRAPAYSHR